MASITTDTSASRELVCTIVTVPCHVSAALSSLRYSGKDELCLVRLFFLFELGGRLCLCSNPKVVNLCLFDLSCKQLTQFTLPIYKLSKPRATFLLFFSCSFCSRYSTTAILLLFKRQQRKVHVSTSLSGLPQKELTLLCSGLFLYRIDSTPMMSLLSPRSKYSKTATLPLFNK
jgi:hypothetical protein